MLLNWMANSFKKLHSNNSPSRFLEDEMQIKVAEYLDSIGVLWHHPANERKTKIQAGVRLKRKGVKPGVPDIIVFEHNKKHNGLAIELKVERSNGLKKNGSPRKSTKGKPTDNQIKWLNSLRERNWSTSICYSSEEAINKINSYLNNEK